MKKPDLITEFEYHGRVTVEWFDVYDKEDIPDYPWQQVYIIGDLDNKVPIVTYNKKQDNLPGGKTEPNESIEQTIGREVREELNMRLVEWRPLGYQVCKRTDTNEVIYQFRAYAKLDKIGEFSSDPGGDVIGHKLVSLHEMNSIINYGSVGQRMTALAMRFFTST